MGNTYSMPQKSAFKRRINSVLVTILTLLLSALFLSGCAYKASADGAPKGQREPIEPLYHNGKTVIKMTSWHYVASDIAASVRKALEDRGDLLDKALYLPPPNASSFPVVFYNLLKSELVSRGLQLAELPEQNVVNLNFSLYKVKHHYSPSSWYYEVAIVARMSHNNRYVMHKSGSYKVRNDDSRLYKNTDAGLGNNASLIDSEAQDANNLWQHYAPRKTAFSSNTAPIMHPRQPITSNAQNYSSSLASSQIILSSNMITEQEINSGGGKRINPNSPPPELKSFRSKKR